MTYKKTSEGKEEWYEYDSKGNKTHEIWSSGSEFWYEYDAKGNQIYFKNSYGTEIWYEYTFHPNGKVKTKTGYRAIQ